jgi:hypothetical protein
VGIARCGLDEGGHCQVTGVGITTVGTVRGKDYGGVGIVRRVAL